MKILPIVLFVLFTMMFAGSQLYQNDIVDGTESRTHFVNKSFNFNSTAAAIETIEKTHTSGMFDFELFRKILVKFIDFLLYAFSELARSAVIYGYDHPEYDFKFYANACLFICFLGIGLDLLYVVIIIGYGFYYLYNWLKKKYDLWRIDNRGLD